MDNYLAFVLSAFITSGLLEVSRYSDFSYNICYLNVLLLSQNSPYICNCRDLLKL